jgi:hypothetical protein
VQITVLSTACYCAVYHTQSAGTVLLSWPWKKANPLFPDFSPLPEHPPTCPCPLPQVVTLAAAGRSQLLGNQTLPLPPPEGPAQDQAENSGEQYGPAFLQPPGEDHSAIYPAGGRHWLLGVSPPPAVSQSLLPCNIHLAC